MISAGGTDWARTLATASPTRSALLKVGISTLTRITSLLSFHAGTE